MDASVSRKCVNTIAGRGKGIQLAPGIVLHVEFLGHPPVMLPGRLSESSSEPRHGVNR